MDGNGETTISYVKILNYPIETTMFINGCFRFQVHVYMHDIQLLRRILCFVQEQFFSAARKS